MTSAERAEETWRKVREQNVLAAFWNERCVDVLTAAFEEARREARVEGLTKAADIVRRRRNTSLAVQGDGSMIRVKPAYLQALDEAEVFILAEAENTVRALQEKPTNAK